MTKHNVFVSYHHEKDQDFANRFRQHYGAAETVFLDRSLLKPLDSKNFEYIMAFIRQNGLKESTVTVVLIGAETRFRKYVDWEIYSSLNQVPGRTRNGLLGILLPGTSIDHVFRNQYLVMSSFFLVWRFALRRIRKYRGGHVQPL